MTVHTNKIKQGIHVQSKLGVLLATMKEISYLKEVRVNFCRECYEGLARQLKLVVDSLREGIRKTGFISIIYDQDLGGSSGITFLIIFLGNRKKRTGLAVIGKAMFCPDSK